ncbi:MAG: hypothetical protein U1E11_05680 [Dethiobacteria bacterium]|nr:hypothetical protein [Dethiobacteria bacterium]
MAKGIFALEAGDILSVYNRDFITDQVFKLGMGASAVVNYRLKDGMEVKWFAARSYGQQLMILGDEVKLPVDQTGEKFDWEGQTYRQLGKTEGRAIGTSEMGYPRYVQMECIDYVNEESTNYIFVQKSEDVVTAFSGEPVIGGAIMVFPKPK